MAAAAACAGRGESAPRSLTGLAGEPSVIGTPRLLTDDPGDPGGAEGSPDPVQFHHIGTSACPIRSDHETFSGLDSCGQSDEDLRLPLVVPRMLRESSHAPHVTFSGRYEANLKTDFPRPWKGFGGVPRSGLTKPTISAASALLMGGPYSRRVALMESRPMI